MLGRPIENGRSLHGALDGRGGVSLWTDRRNARSATAEVTLTGGDPIRRIVWLDEDHEGTVYAVAGSSSKTSGGTLNHPVMITSLNQLGSMVIDIDGDRLDARFLDDNGSVLDVFTMRKGIATTAPVPATALRLGLESENPFRSTLRFRIDTPTPGPVTLSVYDLRGRRVATLSSGERGAGTHFVTWDGRNTRGNSVAPGVYFGVLDHAGEMRTQKIVRIR